MATVGRSIKSFSPNTMTDRLLDVANYPLRKRTAEELKTVEKLKLNRKIQLAMKVALYIYIYI